MGKVSRLFSSLLCPHFSAGQSHLPVFNPANEEMKEKLFVHIVDVFVQVW